MEHILKLRKLFYNLIIILQGAAALSATAPFRLSEITPMICRWSLKTQEEQIWYKTGKTHMDTRSEPVSVKEDTVNSFSQIHFEQ